MVQLKRWGRLVPVNKERRGRIKTPAALRASVSFPPELYRTLEKIAREKKVSIAWVVRDAAEKYVVEQEASPKTK